MVDEYNFGAAIEVVRNGTLIDFEPDHRNENVLLRFLGGFQIIPG